MNNNYFSDEELVKLRINDKLKRHPLPWSGEFKQPRRGRFCYEPPPSFYIIRDANGNVVTQLWDPQDANELLKIVSSI